jgi:hypothetical protein
MAGLISDFGIDLNEVEVKDYDSPSDDIYKFVLGDVRIQEGTQKKPNSKWVIFKYLLGDNGLSYSEWFSLPNDPVNPTDAELTKLSFYKKRILSLGVSAEDINDVTSDELVGTNGTLELRTTKGKDGNAYQNIYRLSVDGGNEAPAAKKAAKPATAVDNPFA